MFDVVDFIIIIVLCSTLIFFLIFFVKRDRRIKINENVKSEVTKGDISPIFYSEDVYQIIEIHNETTINGSEQDNAQVSDISDGHIELGVTSAVDDGDSEDGFFNYQPPDSSEEDDDDVPPVLPQTWGDFMGDEQEQSSENLVAHLRKKKDKKEKEKISSPIKDTVARVRKEIVDKPLSDEDFKKKYFSRLYEDEDKKD
jgi:hypothetical protein